MAVFLYNSTDYPLSDVWDTLLVTIDFHYWPKIKTFLKILWKYSEKFMFSRKTKVIHPYEN